MLPIVESNYHHNKNPDPPYLTILHGSLLTHPLCVLHEVREVLKWSSIV